MGELTRDDVQNMLDQQSEIYAECLGEVEDRLAGKIDERMDKFMQELVAELEQGRIAHEKNMIDVIRKAVDKICSRVYKGVRLQAGNVVRDLGGDVRERKRQDGKAND